MYGMRAVLQRYDLMQPFGWPRNPKNPHSYWLPSGNQMWQWEILCTVYNSVLRGKSSINGGCSFAMFDYWRITH